MTWWSRIAASAVKLPSARTNAVSVERGLIATMPDGVELVADRWYPAQEQGHGEDGVQPATVLIRTPYGRCLRNGKRNPSASASFRPAWAREPCSPPPMQPT